MRTINRKKILFTTFFGVFVAILGVVCVLMEWATAWYLLISFTFTGILIQSLTEQRCPHCGKYALTMGLWRIIQKRPVCCKKCGETIEYTK